MNISHDSYQPHHCCQTLTIFRASWLTVGKQTAQLACMRANDFGSIMIEENVVSAAGAPHRFTYKTIQDAIAEAGFEPQLRNQQYDVERNT
jgi:cyclic dehypoxanthinyl futalosine synthase